MRLFDKLAVGAYAALVAAAFALATGVLELATLESGVKLCLFRFLTGIPCPGCGMAHSLLFGFQGQWALAFHSHLLGLPLLAVWTLWIVHGAANLRRGRGFSEGFPLAAGRGWEGALALGSIFAAYFIRLVGIC